MEEGSRRQVNEDKDPVKHKKPPQKQAKQQQDAPQSDPVQKKQSSKKLPTVKKKKKLNLPTSNDELLEALDSLPEALEAAPQLSTQEAMLKEVYGDDITRLSTTAKKYLMDNHLKMQIITQRVLNRIGRVYIDPRFHYYAYNYVEFTLYPDGHISNIKILKDAGFQLLDKITQETIETAFKDYPLPSEPILVRYKFLYDLRSY